MSITLGKRSGYLMMQCDKVDAFSYQLWLDVRSGQLTHSQVTLRIRALLEDEIAKKTKESGKEGKGRK